MYVLVNDTNGTGFGFGYWVRRRSISACFTRVLGPNASSDVRPGVALLFLPSSWAVFWSGTGIFSLLVTASICFRYYRVVDVVFAKKKHFVKASCVPKSQKSSCSL